MHEEHGQYDAKYKPFHKFLVIEYIRHHKAAQHLRLYVVRGKEGLSIVFGVEEVPLPNFFYYPLLCVHCYLFLTRALFFTSVQCSLLSPPEILNSVSD